MLGVSDGQVAREADEAPFAEAIVGRSGGAVHANPASPVNNDPTRPEWIARFALARKCSNLGATQKSLGAEVDVDHLVGCAVRVSVAARSAGGAEACAYKIKVLHLELVEGAHSAEDTSSVADREQAECLAQEH